MNIAKLTNEQHQFFEGNGYLVVPNVLDESMVESLIAASDPLIVQFEKDGERSGNYVQGRSGIVQNDAFLPLLTNSPTIPLVAQLLTSNIHLGTTAIIYKYPQPSDRAAAAERAWHRDAHIVPDLGHKNLPRVGIKVCYCLTDFNTPKSGFTLFAPGTHLLNTPLPIPQDAVDPPNAIDLCLRAGDAFLFENRLFHTTSANLSTRTSKVVIFGYTYRWKKQDDYLLALDETVLAKVDDIGKQLLGGQSNGLIEWAEMHGIMSEKPPMVMMENMPVIQV